MTFSESFNYLIPVTLISYFLWKQLQYKKIKKQLPELAKQGAILIDVRTLHEFQLGSSSRCINIPLDQISAKAKDLDKEKTIILCCRSGNRSGMAASVLRRQGFAKVLNAGPWTNTLF